MQDASLNAERISMEHEQKTQQAKERIAELEKQDVESDATIHQAKQKIDALESGLQKRL